MLTLFGEETLLFFFGGLSGVGGGVVGLVMIGAGSMIAVFCVLSCVIVDLVVSGRICVDGGDVSFSWLGAGSVGLVVVGGGGGRLAAVCWRGHSPAGGVGRLLLSAPFLSKRWLVVVFRKVTSIFT